MTITLNTTLPPGYLPDASDIANEALLNDPAIQNAAKTTGITVAQYLQLVGLDPTDQNVAKLEPVLEKLLPPPASNGDSHVMGANNGLGRLDLPTLGVDIYSVMAVFQRCAQEMRSQARTVRDSELQAQVSSLTSAADEVRKAASDRMAAAIVQGAFQIAGGAVSMGMSVAGAMKGMQSINESKNAASIGADIEESMAALGKTEETGASPISESADSPTAKTVETAAAALQTTEQQLATPPTGEGAASAATTEVEKTATKVFEKEQQASVSQPPAGAGGEPASTASQPTASGSAASAAAEKTEETATAAEKTIAERQASMMKATLRAKALEVQGQKWTGLAQGVGGFASGLGGTVSATLENAAAQHDAREKDLETDAKVHEQGVQHANDLMQQMQDAIRDVRDKLSAIEQARAQTASGIARNI